MPAREPSGHRDRGVDRVHQLHRRLDRRLRAPAHDHPGDRARVALLAEVAQRVRQAALVPLGDDLAGAQLLLGVHPHVQRRLEGVGEAALARVHLHRGHAEVEVGDVGLQPLFGELLERLGVARADEAHRAGHLAGQFLEALLGERVAIDPDERALGAEALGDQLARGRRRRRCSRSRSGPGAGRAGRSAPRRGRGCACVSCQAGWSTRAVISATPLSSAGRWSFQLPLSHSSRRSPTPTTTTSF